MTLEVWREKLKPGDIPIFRHTANRLRELSPKRDEITARDVANVVLADPFATLQILHALNKKVMDRYGTEVLTVEHALMMQGLGVYLDAARRLPALEDTPAGKDPKSLAALQALARKAQHAAYQARDFAVLHTDVRAEEVEVATLLAYLPDLLFWLRAPTMANKVRRLQRKRQATLLQEALGVPYKTLRLALLEDWSIPPTTIDLIDEKNATRARQVIVASCLSMADLSERGWWHELLLADYIALAGVENSPIETIVAYAHANAARVARTGNWLPQPAAATWGPMIPGDWPPDEADEEEHAITAPAVATAATAPSSAISRASATPSAEPARQTPAKPATQPAAPATPSNTADADDAHEVCPMPDKQVLRDALQGIEGHLDGSLTLNQMSAIILKGVHTGLGLTRILFAMMTPDGHRLKSRFTIGIPSDDPLRGFEFAISGNDLFCQLVGKMQGLWINETNREKLWPMVNPALRKMIGTGDFYAMSLHANGKLVGLIYADRGHGECGLDSHTYTDFKLLCQQAAKGLGKVKA